MVRIGGQQSPGVIPGKTEVKLGVGEALSWPQALCNLHSQPHIDHPS